MSTTPSPAPDVAPGAGAALAPIAPLLGAIMVLLAATLWGTMGLFARLAYAAGAEPLETVSARAAFAFVGLGLLFVHRPRRLAVPVGSLPFFALFGAVSIALFYWLNFAALERIPIGIAAALLYTAPAYTVVLARVAFGESLTGRKIAVLAAVLAGVALVTGVAGTFFGPVRHEGAGGVPRLDTLGLLLGLAAGLTYALFTLFGKRAAARFAAVPTVFWALGFGALFLGVLVPPWRAVAEHPGALLPILALSLLSTLAATLLYISGLRRLEAGVASLLATIEPVVAALLGWVWLGERLGAGQLAGILLIVAGAVALVRRRVAAR